MYVLQSLSAKHFKAFGVEGGELSRAKQTADQACIEDSQNKSELRRGEFKVGGKSDSENFKWLEDDSCELEDTDKQD